MNRPRSARPLADLVRPALADALKAQGFAAADLLRHWPAIVGDRLAGHSMPLRMMWPPRPKAAPPDAGPEPATLIVKVEGALALEVEMASAQIIERINAVFGWRCVSRLRIRQGPVTIAAPKTAAAPPVLPPGEERKLGAALAGVEDEALRDALARLGRAVKARRPVTDA
jgi:hypothetical protein